MLFDYCKWQKPMIFSICWDASIARIGSENYLVGWKGLFQKGIYKVPIIILEAIASYNTWICHSFFGFPRSASDINILNCFMVFSELHEGRAPKYEYIINGHKYNIHRMLSFVWNMSKMVDFRQNNSIS